MCILCIIHILAFFCLHTGFHTMHTFWHVLWRVITLCIVMYCASVFGMYYEMIPVKNSRYINTCKIVQFRSTHRNSTIEVNTQMQTTTYKYLPIHVIHTIHSNVYQYLHIRTDTLTHKCRQIPINTYNMY